ncbi:hypothetical protein BN2475_450128 [Paraburkholderia ribeironis]|uniref:Uncharacterized protein n=1 Tax=Paraburkholderia ribeironis TaxID=1247936 RepID=A0A1N7S914_9BURK|nr:hypothetical protein BN2475_450128 [Paraburkholderia ribeironis]
MVIERIDSLITAAASLIKLKPVAGRALLSRGSWLVARGSWLVVKRCVESGDDLTQLREPNSSIRRSEAECELSSTCPVNAYLDYLERFLRCCDVSWLPAATS